MSTLLNIDKTTGSISASVPSSRKHSEHLKRRPTQFQRIIVTVASIKSLTHRAYCLLSSPQDGDDCGQPLFCIATRRKNWPHLNPHFSSSGARPAKEPDAPDANTPMSLVFQPIFQRRKCKVAAVNRHLGEKSLQNATAISTDGGDPFPAPRRQSPRAANLDKRDVLPRGHRLHSLLDRGPCHLRVHTRSPHFYFLAPSRCHWAPAKATIPMPARKRWSHSRCNSPRYSTDNR